MKTLTFIAVALVCLILNPAYGQENRSGSYFGEIPPTTGAKLFSPGFASTQHHDDMFPVFSPDGREVILRINGKAGGEMIAVLYITRMKESGGWSTPEPLPFLTRHMNGGASFTPDGSRIYFTTKRPPPGEDPADVHSRLWFSERTEKGWEDAHPVDTPINQFNLNGGCFLSADGTMYASFVAPGEENHDIYELNPVDGAYPEYHPLPGDVNSPGRELVPFVNKDEGYLLFTSFGDDGLKIKMSVLDKNGRWSAPEVVDELTEPEAKFVRASRDGKYLFFVSHKQTEHSNPQSVWTIDDFDEPAMENNADIYWMDAGFISQRASERRAGKTTADH